MHGYVDAATGYAGTFSIAITANAILASNRSEITGGHSARDGMRRLEFARQSPGVDDPPLFVGLWTDPLVSGMDAAIAPPIACPAGCRGSSCRRAMDGPRR